MRAAVYSRKSRVIDGNSRSVEEQQADCLLVCGRNGWRVAHVLVDDDRSASRYARREREDFAALLRLIEDGAIDVVVTWEASRSTRDLEVYSMLRGLCESRGVRWCYSGRLYDFADADDRFATGLDVLSAEREA